MPPRWLVWSTLLGLVAVSPEAARACTSCDESIVSLRGVTLRPRSDQTDVPTNTLVWVDYDSYARLPGAAGRLSLRTKAGAPVDATVEERPAIAPADRCQSRLLARLRPAQPLLPDTTYEVLDEVGAVPCTGAECDTIKPRVINTFTTGARPDTSPPRFAGVARSHSQPSFACDDGACCGPYRAMDFDVSSVAAADEGGIAFYEVSIDGALVDAIPEPSLQGFVFCSGGAVKGPPGQLRATGHYRFNAVDLAGNRDPNTKEVSVSPSCSGCSYAGGPAPSCASLAVLAFLLVRRRRLSPGLTGRACRGAARRAEATP
jgi:hypothetical protein